MSETNYQLVYDVTEQYKNGFDFLSDIFSTLIIYFCFFVVWKLMTQGENRKLGIGLTIVFFLINISETIRKVEKYSPITASQCAYVEGKVYDYVSASYYNRRGGYYYVNGQKFTTSMHGIDKDMGRTMHFSNGRQVKIYYVKSSHKKMKFWIEDYRDILTKECNDHNYTACFEASKAYHKEDRAKAKILLMKSLDGNSSDYALVVAKMYHHGILFDKNISRALKFYDQSCERGKESACGMFLKLYSEREDMPVGKKEVNEKYLNLMD